MKMHKDKYFDPTECIRGIQHVLSSDKKKIAFLFGAGTSLAHRNNEFPHVPAIAKMTELIEIAVSKRKEYENVLSEIKTELADSNLGFNIETILTNIEDKVRIIGAGTLNKLVKKDFENLLKLIQSEIIKIVSVHRDLNASDARKLVQYDFARWIKNADRKRAIEIFTTNYDYLIEIGLEEAEVPYYDGFTGSYNPFFDSDSLGDMNFIPRQTKLWKIHGSLGLHEEDIQGRKRIIRKHLSQNIESEDILIYPSAQKYSNSKKMPYTAFMDRLNAFLKQDDAVLFVCGYSFGDEHINERIISALNSNSTSCVYVFLYDIEKNASKKIHALTSECKLSQIASSNNRISVLATRNAIIGSVYGIWKLKREPAREDPLNIQLYFDEDAPINTAVELNVENNDNEIWTGEGELTLPDFTRFITFLQNMIHGIEGDGDVDE